ncbi:MAG: outer membrane protein transport protein [Deltaproteobacteria bacterium]|nr:outer membrane protein transport protein [Deltaproteobacteria bacterium]
MLPRALLLLALAPALAHANTPDDVYGVSPRTIAMGGAGTALPGDYSGAHYNPANLAHCPTSLVALDVSRIQHSLSFTDDAPAPGQEPLAPKRVRNQTRFTLGACMQLPFELSLGFLLNLGVPGAISLDQQTANQQPNFALYGENNEQVSLALGLSWRATRTLSIGAGFAVLFQTELPLNADFPILEPDPSEASGYRPVGFGLGVSMGAIIGPRFGVLWSPSPRFRIGAAYRGALYHDLDVDALITAKLIVEIPVPVHVDSLSWFSPRQFSLGASGEPARNFTIAADVTYYRWGELRSRGSSYPFLNMYSLDPEGASGALIFPRPIRSGWKNNFAYRVGGELRSGPVSFRGGLGYRTAAVNSAEDSNVNLLDGPVATASTGFSWSAGSTEKSATPRRWWRYKLPDVTFKADVFVRLDHMMEQRVDHTATPGDEVPEKHYSYSGNVIQFGAMATLGW